MWNSVWQVEVHLMLCGDVQKQGQFTLLEKIYHVVSLYIDRAVMHFVLDHGALSSR